MRYSIQMKHALTFGRREFECVLFERVIKYDTNKTIMLYIFIHIYTYIHLTEQIFDLTLFKKYFNRIFVFFKVFALDALFKF